MKPIVKEFNTDEDLMVYVKELESNGVDKRKLYVISSDNERTRKVANYAGVSKIGAREMGVRTSVGNFFHKKSDGLRTQLKEIGLSFSEADEYGNKLEQGNILLITVPSKPSKTI